MISAIVSIFVEKLDKISESEEYVDALVWFNYLAFDLLSDLAFGEPIGMVEKVRFLSSSVVHSDFSILGIGRCSCGKG